MAGAEEGGVSSPPFRIGQRVSKAGSANVGTVKYVGSVEGYQGPWIGVDWDSGTASHDGSLNGIRYFEAHGQNSASFVRPHLLYAGRSFLDAMVLKYKGESKGLEEDMYVLSVHQKRVSVELVGKEKIEKKLKHFEELVTASLVYENISSCGELENIFPNLKELDLTGNLLPDWNTVALICSQLPSLKILDLSKNRLQMGNASLCGLAHLQTLILNYCQITWRQVEVLEQSLPILEELHLCGNNIKYVEVADGCRHVEGFKCLKLLNLENNCIDSWVEILKLSNLERLEQLQVSHNRLKEIFYPVNDADVTMKSFASLRCLLLAGNAIEDWGSVDSLNRFPNLKEVRLSDNPLTDLNAGGAPRYLLVAHLGNISVLNGSKITPRERRDSEIRYVHYVMSSMPTSDINERTQTHPRFLELKELYDLDEDRMLCQKGVAEKMATRLIAVTLECVAPSAGEKPPAFKKLPPSTTIGKLKLICESLFKVKASKQHLFVRDKDTPVPMSLGDDLETLGDAGIGTDMTILVDEN